MSLSDVTAWERWWRSLAEDCTSIYFYCFEFLTHYTALCQKSSPSRGELDDSLPQRLDFLAQRPRNVETTIFLLQELTL